MKVTGIIVEYNPLHNGHVHHIEETRRLSNCDVLVAVMSSNFMQRGEPALIDKFTRTKMALANNIDLVLELPFVFSVQNADIFAKAAVEILSHIGVDSIYFGSESNDIKELEKFADIIETDAYNQLVKKYSKEGNSYPTSSDLAMKDLFKSESFDKPNNILGVQYIKASRSLNRDIELHTIKRLQSDYYANLNETKTIQSATAIRKAIFDDKDISNYVPKNVFELLDNRKSIHFDDFTDYFKYKLSNSSPNELKEIIGVEEGLENRILKSKDFDTSTSLLNLILTRRYTNSKIRRTLTHILCNTQKSLFTTTEIPYIRILGMNETGKSYLNEIKKDFYPPIISKVKEGIHPYLDMELQASKVYSLVSDIDVFKEEFKPLIFKRIN